jgi:hypothetical protein
MRRVRISIAGLMAVVLFCAVGVAALRAASETWAGLILTATLAILAVGLLGAIYRRGPAHAFWGGFALFGWGYLLLCFGPWFASEVQPHLASTGLLDRLYPQIAGVSPTDTATYIRRVWLDVYGTPPPPQAVSAVRFSGDGTKIAEDPWAAVWQWAGAGQGFRGLRGPAPGPFRRIGHCLWALMAAMVGGLAARRFRAMGPDPEEPSPCPPGASSPSPASTT